MTDLGKYLFDELVCMNEGYRERLPCICEEMMENMVGRWTCQKHGLREPNYAAIDAAEDDYFEEDEYKMDWDELSDAGRQRRIEKRIETAELRRDERRERRHPGDFDIHPSNEQMEYFKRGGR